MNKPMPKEAYIGAETMSKNGESTVHMTVNEARADLLDAQAAYLEEYLRRCPKSTSMSGLQKKARAASMRYEAAKLRAGLLR